MNPPTPPICRFGLAEVEAAADAWGFNCGPAALCAVLGLTPTELRPHLGDFEARGYTNPTLMAEILRGLRMPFRRVFECCGAREADPSRVRYPYFGLVRIQWAGPWTQPGRPVADDLARCLRALERIHRVRPTWPLWRMIGALGECDATLAVTLERDAVELEKEAPRG